eukprot:CAMPEP_0113551534 /NCGR_PEP_ID=MMETSP0015_2-20120614/14576_1 /TAXON_ID=2838 /ORGANISM="Odontella" /LENGTH=430 /DNA_ID=CAMNT_0000452433 /DNA_START=347 /DNA_END=1639 /DNA_ORIENTATION=- /assembly_acc=CAM_ASM_000160
MGYLNKHHSDLLADFATVFTEIGEEKAKKNAFSGGSFRIEGAKIVGLDATGIDLDVIVKARSDREAKIKRTGMKLDVDPIKAMSRVHKTLPMIPREYLGTNPVDDFVRRMNRLCLIVNRPAVTGKLIQLAIQIGGDGVGKVHDNLYLNQVPHNRFVRQYFYDMASDAALDAVIQCSEGKISNRMKMTVMFPEMNPSMDSYRIGTLLELTRDVGIKLAEQNLRVRICVQSSMGVGIFTGVPKQLSGVATLLQRMDWQSGEGEENEGMIGNYINFGAIGKEHVANVGQDKKGKRVEQDDVFILICPQSMVGVESSIMGPLSEMVDAAGDRPVILINPDLSDKQSSQGQQGVRGRQDRMDFADSFKPIFHFSNTYVSGTSYFPILGSLCKMNPSALWVAHQRRDLVQGGEVYVPVLSTEEPPTGDLIMSSFEK